METSIHWPWPVRSRCSSAVVMAPKANVPPMLSAMAEPALVGGPSGKPVKFMRPETAWVTAS